LRNFDWLSKIILSETTTKEVEERILLRTTHTLREKQQALYALSGLIDLLGYRLNSFVPKVLTTLQQALQIPMIRSQVCDVWEMFAHTLGPKHIGPCLNQIVVSLVPYIEGVNEQPQQQQQSFPNTSSSSSSSSSLLMDAKEISDKIITIFNY